MLLKHFGIYDIFCGSLTGDIAAGSGYDHILDTMGSTSLTGDIAAGSGYD